MVKASPGDIVLLNFPFSSKEIKPYKQRPVLVLSCLAGGERADESILVAMVTGNQRRWNRPHAGDFRIDRWQEFGLVKESVIRTRRLWTAESQDVLRLVGRVDQTLLDKARQTVISSIDPQSS